MHKSNNNTNEYTGQDFYCDMVLNNRVKIKIEFETENVLAFYHTRPFWPLHIVVIPKRHIDSLLTLREEDSDLFLEIFEVIKEVARRVNERKGEVRILTNLGNYQDSKHLHFHVVSGESTTHI